MPDGVGRIGFEDFADIIGEIRREDFLDAVDRISAAGACEAEATTVR